MPSSAVGLSLAHDGPVLKMDVPRWTAEALLSAILANAQERAAHDLPTSVACFPPSPVRISSSDEL